MANNTSNFSSVMEVINVPLHGNHENGDDDGSNPNIAKATAMCVLFLCSFTLGLIPIKLTKWLVSKDKKGGPPDSNKYVQMLLGIGGGVLLCTTFLHLLPEVAESFEKLDFTPNIEIHYAELLMCIGFFVMYLVEECVHVYLRRREEKAGNPSTLFRTLSIRRGDTPRQSLAQETKLTEVIDNSEFGKPSKHNHEHHGEHHHSHFVHGDVDSTVKAIRGLLVVLALSVHELFEGLAVGLESSAKNVWYMFGAVSAHKLVIAFCIGVELVSSNMKNVLVVIYVFTFAVVSPLGIGIGMAISNIEQDSSEVISVFLQGLASGTLLYVVFFEILQNERKSGLRQFLAVFIGFACMFGMTILD
ncbi:zinc transporter ZIP3-like [Euwallacea similis]|uniref:zinc transporter ZIP3-like n=1 Tax=Euwallacea similis TaxID=1736056 RepID=UPI00344B6DB1